MCNCFIGFIRDYHPKSLYIDSYVEQIKAAFWQYEFNLSTIPELYKNYGAYLVKPSDYFDRRRGRTKMFSHCPECGKKINWKEIKKKLDDN